MDYAETKLQAARRFLQPIQENSEHSSVLDAGCGDGIHANVVVEMFGDLSSYYGVDLSKPALLSAKKRNQGGNFICSDIGFLPFEDDVFDVTISYGVLAYTASPESSFGELCRVTKRGGLVGVWFYPKPTGLSWYLVNAVRSVSKKAPAGLVDILADCIVPFLAFLPTSSRVNLSNATWAQCKEVVLVNIAPKKLWYPEKNEIVRMFRKNGVDIVETGTAEDITLWGVKN